MPTVSYQVQSGYADASEWGGGVKLSDTSIYLTFPTDVALLRFINIDIPQGSVISTATLTLDDFNPSGTGTTRIYAERSGNPAPLLASDVGTTAISTRVRTGNYVDWAFVGISFGTAQTSGDIKAVIQEVVNQSTWERGNAIHLLCVGQAGGRLGACAYERNPSKAAILTINYAERVAGLAMQGKNKRKDFFLKVFNPDGTYLATWGSDIVNVPTFTWSMNGGMGELNLQLKRPLGNFGESVDVAFGNLVECWVQDGDQEVGRKIWSGRINRYEPSSDGRGTEVVNVIATSRLLEMEKRLIKNGNATEVGFFSVDPSNILRSLISMPSAGGILTAGLIQNTGTTVSYTFQANTIREGFDTVTKLCPQYWYWWLDAENAVHLKLANFEEVDHTLMVGKQVSAVRMTKTTEQLANRVYFMGGGSPNLYKMYERTGSQAAYGLREVLLKDERVTVNATAEILATSYLDNFDHPVSEVVVDVVDSNIDPIDGYDIERFRPGDIVQILHPSTESRRTYWDQFDWDVGFWDFDIRYSLGQPLQILEINYGFNRCTLRLNQKLENFQKRIEDIDRNLAQTATVNLPSAPT